VRCGFDSEVNLAHGVVSASEGLAGDWPCRAHADCGVGAADPGDEFDPECQRDEGGVRPYVGMIADLRGAEAFGERSGRRARRRGCAGGRLPQ
jgi:hypothetical protein